MSALCFLHQVNIVLLFLKLLRPFTLSDMNLKTSAIKCYVHFKNRAALEAKDVIQDKKTRPTGTRLVLKDGTPECRNAGTPEY